MNQLQWDLGDGIAVRTYVAGDAEELFALVDANRDRLRPWMIWEPTTKTVDDTRAFIQACLASTDYEGNGLWLDGRLVGGAGLSLDTMANSGEIGYWLAGDARGSGDRHASLRAVLRLRLRRARAAPDGAAGGGRQREEPRRGRTPRHARGGVARDGCRVADGYLDSVTYGILEDEWRARRADAT